MEEMNPTEERKERNYLSALIPAVLVLISLFVLSFYMKQAGMEKQIFLPQNYPIANDHMEKNKWYSIFPYGAVDSVGDPWHGLIRIGNENKVIVYFYGGGMSINEKTAAMGDDMYIHHARDTGTESTGICGRDERNPFRDWTILAIPYSTADLHIGTKEFPYTDRNGERQILRHNGYNNFRLFMDQAVQYARTPDTILVAGWSAGGFGAAFLADTVFSDYYPRVIEKAVLADSALLHYDAFRETASSVWGAPSKITKYWHSDNPVRDSLEACRDRWPKAKILFACSYRDGGLVQYQNYINTGVFLSDEALGDVFEEELRDFVTALLELPDTGVYIWADWLGTSSLTPHTILWTQFYSKGYNGESCASWLNTCMNGETENHGLDLFAQGIPVLTDPPPIP